MAERIDVPTSNEVANMFKEILQVVRDGHQSLHDQQARLSRLLEEALEGVDNVCLPEKTPAAPATFHVAVAGVQSEYTHSTTGTTGMPRHSVISETDTVFDSLSPSSCRRGSIYSEIIRDLSKRTSNELKSIRDLNASSCRERLKKFVRGPRFDFVMAFAILLNSVYIGVEIDRSIHGGESGETIPLMEYFFLLVFIVELLLRMWAFGTKNAFSNYWNCFDMLLVSIGSVSLLLMEPIKRQTDFGEGGEVLQQITIFRVLRLLRLVRSLRLLTQFRILWGLVNGLLHALPTMLSTLVLLILLIFIFACGGVELITKNKDLQAAALHDPSLTSILDLHFGSLPKVSLTLIRFTTMDSVGLIYEPLVREQPSLILYFVFLLLVISITIMNLVTAVMVEHSIQTAKTDSELETHMNRKKIKAMIPQIEELFTEMDSNNDGRLTMREVRRSDARMPAALAHLVAVDTLVDLFEALDSDNSGFVDKDEFVEGLIELALSEVPLETIKILHHCRIQKKQLKKMIRHLQLLGGQVASSSMSLGGSFDASSIEVDIPASVEVEKVQKHLLLM